MSKPEFFIAEWTHDCSCADNPTPLSEIAAYCEVLFDIDKVTAATTLTLLS